MIISIASGKGGTGKTTIAVNFALSLKNVQLLDCDVEEPNAALFLNPLITEEKKAMISVPVIDKEKCSHCGKCRDVCAYNALAVLLQTKTKKGQILFFPNLCHGCGACEYFCPENAISEQDRETGVLSFGTAGDIQFIQGKLNTGEAMAPPVIRQVKDYINPTRTVIIDAPPGTSCPVMTAVKDTDYCLLVTEPTPFGLNDLELAVAAMKELNLPFGVIINRCDLGDERTERFCRENKIPILMRIPFDEKIAKSYSCGDAFIHDYPEYRQKFQELFERIAKEDRVAFIKNKADL